MNYAVVLANGDAIEVEDAEVEHDPIENALIFRFESGVFSKFYWPNVSYYVALPESM